MVIENTVSSHFSFAFVDCLQRFRLPPIRYDVDSSIVSNNELLNTFFKQLHILIEQLGSCVYLVYLLFVCCKNNSPFDCKDFHNLNTFVYLFSRYRQYML